MAREELRLQHLADVHHLQTAQDLREFLANDPKTCRDEKLRRFYFAAFQSAVPRLRS